MSAHEEEMEEKEGNEDGQADHPWPHLKKYFLLKHLDASSNATFTCARCQPKKIEIKSHASSLSNLKLHMKRKHCGIYKQVKFNAYRPTSSSIKIFMNSTCVYLRARCNLNAILYLQPAVGPLCFLKYL